MSLGYPIFSGTLAITNGGTGQTTASAAFDALSPVTTRGDMIYRNATANARLAVSATSGQVLASNGTDPGWADPGSFVIMRTTINTAIAAGATSYTIDGSSSLVARFAVPTGKSLYVLGTCGGWDTGAGVGTWTIRCVCRKNGATVATLQTVTTSSASSTGSFSNTGTLASTLVTYAAGDLLQVGWENDASSPGAMGTNNKSIWVWGVLL